MFSKTAIIALTVVAAHQSAPAPPFAIQCTGSAEFTDNMSGQDDARRYDLPVQTYVLDEANGNVQRALEPRQQFEDVCFRGGYIDSRAFTPGLITVRSEALGRLCDFTVNRSTGAAEYLSHEDMPGGRFSRIEFDMICEPAEIPVFDSTRNRF